MDIQPTETAEVLYKLLSGIRLTDNVRPKGANYTAKGTEAYLEYNGVFYHITVEPACHQPV